MARATSKGRPSKAAPARGRKAVPKASPARAKPAAQKKKASSRTVVKKVARAAASRSPRKGAAPSKKPPAKPQPKAPTPAPPPKPVAKTAAPAPPKKEAPRKPRKPEMTPREIAAIKAVLEAQRMEFTREAEEIDEGAFNVSQSEMSGEVSFDEEYADAGSFTFEREKELSIGNNVRDLIDKVEHALAAIARGTYGICENCGDPIAKARLQALPYSTMCLKCKQQEERTR